MNRLATSLVIVTLVASGFGLYQLKYKTQRLQTDVRALEAALVSDAAAIRVLKAEWTYLTRPDRIAALSERYLALDATGAAQVAVSADMVARRDDPSIRLVQVDDFRAPRTLVVARGDAVPDRGPATPALEPGGPVHQVKRHEPAPVAADAPAHVAPAHVAPAHVAPAHVAQDDSGDIFDRLRVALGEGRHD